MSSPHRWLWLSRGIFSAWLSMASFLADSRVRPPHALHEAMQHYLFRGETIRWWRRDGRPAGALILRASTPSINELFVRGECVILLSRLTNTNEIACGAQAINNKWFGIHIRRLHNGPFLYIMHEMANVPLRARIARYLYKELLHRDIFVGAMISHTCDDSEMWCSRLLFRSWRK